MIGVLSLVLLVFAAPAERSPETPAAREQVRLCLEKPREAGIEACRQALALGLAPSRAMAVRRALALKLIALARPSEALEVYRDAARAHPDDAEAQLRLGQGLLSMAGDAEAALPVLERARELRPDEPRTHAAVGLALSALRRPADAAAAFQEAERLDPDYFRSRPAARRAFAAAREGKGWP